MKAIIFAEGPGERWNQSRTAHSRRLDWLPDYKHWLDCGGVSIIGRTAKMLADKDIYGTVIAPQSFRRAVWPFDVNTQTGMVRAEPGPLLDGLAASRGFWDSEKTLFLMGDVLFSRARLNQVVGERGTSRPLVFFGRKEPNPLTGKEAPEIFGFAATSGKYNTVMKAAIYLCSHGRNKLWDAKLWSLYRHLGQSEFLDLEGDWSDDVDSPEEYEEFWPALQDQAIHDAL